ncbi:serine protease [Pelagibius sp. Alg239-R121]|uniref:trypsin-like serine peptidase n=1 Tax=Pelagibius sp. Alg239-R121 TaxID=2993448 RepID=UPI0024A7189C|nr:trypsin-like serine protease [Pelagibius sp. Alg239-R121]
MLFRLPPAVVAAAVGSIAVTALSAQAQAVAIRHDAPEALYLKLGAQFTSVGYLPLIGGSAVLVAPDKLLTAAHVVDENRDGKLDNEVLGSPILFGADVNKAIDAVGSIKSVEILPQYYSPVDNANDVAVITLETPITNIEPAKINLSNIVGKVVTVVGYGVTGTGADIDPDELEQDGRRRAAQNTADAIGPMDADEPEIRGVILTDFDDPSGDSSSLAELAEDETISDPLPIALEGIGVPGDSGGGVFADFGQGYRLVGINSAGTHPDDDEGTPYGRYGSLELNAPLSRPDTIDFLSRNGVSFENPQIAVSEPSTAILFVAGLLVISGFAGRRLRA